MYYVSGIRNNVGDLIKAGLPNITGDSWLRPNWNNMNENGAFYLTAEQSRNPVTGSFSEDKSSSKTVGFNASKSNSIYGNSDTVQPLTTQMYLEFYIN